MCHPAYVQRLRDNSQQLVLSFHHVGPGAWTQVANLEGKHLLTSSAISLVLKGSFGKP